MSRAPAAVADADLASAIRSLAPRIRDVGQRRRADGGACRHPGALIDERSAIDLRRTGSAHFILPVDAAMSRGETRHPAGRMRDEGCGRLAESLHPASYILHPGAMFLNSLSAIEPPGSLRLMMPQEEQPPPRLCGSLLVAREVIPVGLVLPRSLVRSGRHDHFEVGALHPRKRFEALESAIRRNRQQPVAAVVGDEHAVLFAAPAGSPAHAAGSRRCRNRAAAGTARPSAAVSGRRCVLAKCVAGIDVLARASAGP